MKNNETIMKQILMILSIVIMVMVTNFCVAFEVKVATEVSPTAFLKWNPTNGAIPITLNSAGPANVSIASVESAVLGALNNWQNVPGQSARFQYDGQNPLATKNNTDSMNSITWMDGSWPYPSNVLAFTVYSYYIDNPPYFVDADILLNGRDFKWSTTSSTNGATQDIQQVLTHELGHLLGLSHTAVSGASLYPYMPAKVSRLLSSDDKAGEQFLYGPSITTLQQITPVAKAVYPAGLASKGLPMPVLRWGSTGGATSYSLEFSDTTTFGKKITIVAGTNAFYALNSAQLAQLEKLSAKKKIFWRVCSGSTKATARLLTFKTA